MSSLVGALYDSMLQSALRQFFERATLDAEPTTSAVADGRLAIEPSANPSALIIRWFGTRYTLRVPGRWAFTAHEVRLAQAIGAVLAARYHAIHNPRIIAERNGLFSGAIEDRYVGAFLDHRPYAIEGREARARLRRAQPLAGDQDFCGRRGALHVSRRRVAPARCAGGTLSLIHI